MLIEHLHLLGGLLLLLLLLLGIITTFLLCGSFLNWRGCFLNLLLFLLDGTKESDNFLGLDHVLVGAGTTNLTKKGVKLGLGHEDTNVVEGSTEVIFVKGTVLVDVHQLEAVLVHLELLLGE